MNQWQQTTLGAALDVRHGFAFKGEYFKDSGDLIVLTPGNFHDEGGFKAKSGKEKYYDGPYPGDYLLTRGDVVIAMTEQSLGLLGSSATIPASNRYLHNQRIGLVRITNPKLLDLRFAYHLMNYPSVREQIQATATGAKIRHTAPERIKAIRVTLPDIETQHIVAATLDAIDDLVENNRRRVEVLEELTRAIYREWFVHFGYPGRASAGLIESRVGQIPEDWGVVDLGQVIELRYGKALKKEDRLGGNVAVVGSSGVVGWHSQKLFAGPVVVLGRKGNVGSVTWVDCDAWPIDTTYSVATHLPLRYVAEQLRNTEFVDSHAAVPGLSRELAYGRPFLRPPDRVMQDFVARVDPLEEQATSLRKLNLQLVALRTFLLPRLYSGQVDVSSLDPEALLRGGAA